MNINDISSAMRAGNLLSAIGNGLAGTANSSAAAGTDKVAKAFERADQRLQQQRDSTSAQVSSFGQLKSAVSDVQGAARALGTTTPTSSSTELARAADTFVKAFNGGITAARASQTQAGASTEGLGARRAEGDLRRSVGNGSLTAELQKIGISQQSDGTLKIDTTKFNAAAQSNSAGLRETLAKVGNKVQATATRELADTGSVGASLKSLNSRASSLQTRQTEQQSLVASLQKSANSQSNSFGNNAGSALAAYRSIYGLA